MKRRLSTAFLPSKKKKRVQLPDLPTELLTSEIMSHLGHSGQLKQLARLAMTCKAFYVHTNWRQHATRIVQYIRGWKQETFDPFAPYVEEMIWFMPCHHGWSPLDLRECHALKRLQLFGDECGAGDFDKPFLPEQLEELYYGPNMHLSYMPHCYLPPSLTLLRKGKGCIPYPYPRGFRYKVHSLPYENAYEAFTYDELWQINNDLALRSVPV